MDVNDDFKWILSQTNLKQKNMSSYFGLSNLFKKTHTHRICDDRHLDIACLT